MARTVKACLRNISATCLHVLVNVGWHHYNDHVALTDQAHASLVERWQAKRQACTACHYLDQANFIGPHLVCTTADLLPTLCQYEYSPAMRAHQGAGVRTPCPVSDQPSSWSQVPKWPLRGGHLKKPSIGCIFQIQGLTCLGLNPFQ